MLLTDIILVVVLLGFVGAGWKDGFVHTFGRFVGAILGFIAARAWSFKISGALALFMPVGWARLAAFLVIFLLITRLVGFVFKLVDGAFRILSIIPFLKPINSLLGGILGFVEGIILTGGAIWLIKTYVLIPQLITWLATSTVARWIDGTFHIVLGVLL